MVMGALRALRAQGRGERHTERAPA